MTTVIYINVCHSEYTLHHLSTVNFKRSHGEQQALLSSAYANITAHPSKYLTQAKYHIFHKNFHISVYLDWVGGDRKT
jgi:hypothetical protein